MRSIYLQLGCTTTGPRHVAASNPGSRSDCTGGRRLQVLQGVRGCTPHRRRLTPQQAEPGDEVVNEAFFRKYRRMPTDAKHRLRQTLDACDEQP
jgi:hypothetical protein